jgi:hypothetical protein
MVGLLRQSVFGRLAGYEDVNLRHDPAMRWIVDGKAAQGRAASPSEIGRFEIQWLAAPANLSALADLSGQWMHLVHGRRRPRGIVLDMDSSVSPTLGEQEMSVWNGHYACTCYRPLFVFNQFGDLRRCHARFSYQAASWSKPRRVIAKVEWHPGELYPRVGFIVTNMSRPAERVVATTSVARASNGSREARAQSNGRGCRAGRSRPRRAAPTSCVRLQPRQFPAHAGEARADQDPMGKWIATGALAE